MKILCLNLVRATKRREMIESEWVGKHGFDIEFFNAFDRRELELGNYPFEYNEEKTIKLTGRPLSNGEIACAISHLMLLNYALDEGHNEIVVMEDDIRPTEFTSNENMKSSISQCKSTFPQASVLIMHDDEGRAKVAESKNGISILSFPPYGYRLVWLNRNAMEMLARDLSTMSYPADHLWLRRFVPMKVLAMTDKPLGYSDAKDTYIGNELRNGDKIYIP